MQAFFRVLYSIFIFPPALACFGSGLAFTGVGGGGIFSAFQPLNFVAQLRGQLKLQQPRGLLHLLGQPLNCLLALGAAHTVLAHPLVFLAHADFKPVADGFDDGFGRDAVFFIVGVLNGAAALGLHDGALHAGRDLICVHEHNAVGVAGRAAIV